MKHVNLSMFSKDEKEGAFHWRDININNDLASLESTMLVRFANSLIGIISIPILNPIFFYIQSRPYLSEVTACQVLIGTFNKELESINYADNKGQFEKLLQNIEKKETIRLYS